MNKKAFTLVELLGTIVILAVVALIAFPAVLGLLTNSQNEADEASKNMMISATRQYVQDNINNFPRKLESDTSSSDREYGDTGKITGQKLVDGGYISTTVISKTKNCNMLDDYVKVTSTPDKYNYTYVENTTDEECE